MASSVRICNNTFNSHGCHVSFLVAEDHRIRLQLHHVLPLHYPKQHDYHTHETSAKNSRRIAAFGPSIPLIMHIAMVSNKADYTRDIGLCLHGSGITAFSWHELSWGTRSTLSPTCSQGSTALPFCLHSESTLPIEVPCLISHKRGFVCMLRHACAMQGR